MFTISPCSITDRRLFEELPEYLHRSDLRYVPPLPGSVVKLLGPKSAFARRHGEVFPFLARKNGQPVGRIAAIINRTHNSHYGDQTGFFGFFDCIDDPTPARLLFEAAGNLLRDAGKTTMRGPYNPSINEDCGILTEGFHERVQIGMPWNPEYIPGLIEASGLSPVRKLFALTIRKEQFAPTRLERIIARTLRNEKLKVRPIDMKHLDRELRIIERLYNTSLDRNWGFIPITLEELEEAAEGLRVFARNCIINFAELADRPVAFSICLPNLADFQKATKKQAGLLRQLNLAFRILLTRPESFRLAILGVAPEHRDKALGALLYCETLNAVRRKGYDECEVSWIEENNEAIFRAAALMQCRPAKSYALYEKNLPTEGAQRVGIE